MLKIFLTIFFLNRGRVSDFIEPILGLIYASNRRFDFVVLMNDIRQVLNLEGVFYCQLKPFLIR